MASTFTSNWTRNYTPPPPVDTTWTQGLQTPLAAQQQIQGTRQSIVDMMQTVNALYEEAINRGRTKEAYDLRDAAERMSRIGSEIGVSSWARQQAIQDLSAKMRNAALVTENQMLLQRSAQNANSLQTLKNLDEQSFKNAFDVQKWVAEQNRQQQMTEQAHAQSQADEAARPLQQAQQNYFTLSKRDSPTHNSLNFGL